MNLILLGAPGAGKGTQARILSRILGIPSISTGNILREAIKNKTELGLKAKDLIDRGQLVSDDVILNIIRERLAKEDCGNGYILDGVPRTIPQAEALEAAGLRFDHVISIEIDDAVIEKRMQGRRVCSACDIGYHLIARPPKRVGVCDVCGGPLSVRSDDAPETVRARLAVYHRQTEPLKEFYSKRGHLRMITGNESIEQATRDIMAAIGMDNDICQN